MRMTYNSVRKSFQIPKENIEPLLRDLEAKLKQESDRVGALAFLKSYGTSLHKKIKVEKVDYQGALSLVDYGFLKIDKFGKEGATVTLTERKNLVIRPWVVDDVLKQYGK